jgi:hypothetical protein
VNPPTALELKLAPEARDISLDCNKPADPRTMLPAFTASAPVKFAAALKLSALFPVLVIPN